MPVAFSLRSSAIGPLALIFAAVCLVPAAVLASFGLAFAVLDVPVEPYVVLVEQAFVLLPTQHALIVLPVLGLALLVAAGRLTSSAARPRRILMIAAAAVLAFGLGDQLLHFGSL